MDEDKNNEPKTVVAISKSDLGIPSPDDPEESWSFLVPFAIPAVILALVVGAFLTFKSQKSENKDLNLNYNAGTEATAAASGKVAGKKVAEGPKPPKSTKPSPSPVVSVTLQVSPSPSPSPSQSSPTPDPTPKPESLSWERASCTGDEYTVYLRWTGSGPDWEISIDDDSSFGSPSKKKAESNSTEAPSGFDNGLVLKTGTTYKWKISYPGSDITGPDILEPSC